MSSQTARSTWLPATATMANTNRTASTGAFNIRTTMLWDRERALMIRNEKGDNRTTALTDEYQTPRCARMPIVFGACARNDSPTGRRGGRIVKQIRKRRIASGRRSFPNGCRCVGGFRSGRRINAHIGNVIDRMHEAGDELVQTLAALLA